MSGVDTAVERKLVDEYWDDIDPYSRMHTYLDEIDRLKAPCWMCGYRPDLTQ